MKSLAFILLLSFTITIVQAQDESDIIEEVQDVYEDMEFFSAEFVQKERFKITGSENITNGNIYVKDGTKYRLETEDMIVVTDGKTVWNYSTMNNKVIIDYVKEDDASLLPRDILFRYPKNYLSSLIGEEEIGDSKYFVLKMIPKDDVHGYIKSMKIWVNSDSYQIMKLEYNDLNDNTSSFKIKKTNTSKELQDSFFTFEMPAGCEVLDLR